MGSGKWAGEERRGIQSPELGVEAEAELGSGWVRMVGRKGGVGEVAPAEARAAGGVGMVPLARD